MGANDRVIVEVLRLLELAAHRRQFFDRLIERRAVVARGEVAGRRHFGLQQRRIAEIEDQVEARICEEGRGRRRVALAAVTET